MSFWKSECNPSERTGKNWQALDTRWMMVIQDQVDKWHVQKPPPLSLPVINVLISLSCVDITAFLSKWIIISLYNKKSEKKIFTLFCFKSLNSKCQQWENLIEYQKSQEMFMCKAITPDYAIMLIHTISKQQWKILWITKLKLENLPINLERTSRCKRHLMAKFYITEKERKKKLLLVSKLRRMLAR